MRNCTNFLPITVLLRKWCILYISWLVFAMLPDLFYIVPYISCIYYASWFAAYRCMSHFPTLPDLLHIVACLLFATLPGSCCVSCHVLSCLRFLIYCISCHVLSLLCFLLVVYNVMSELCLLCFLLIVYRVMSYLFYASWFVVYRVMFCVCYASSVLVA